MTEYSVEEVWAMASDLRAAPGTSMIGTHISLPTAMAVAIYEALCAYTERIEADELAVPVGEVFGPKALSTMVALTIPLPPGTKLFTRPPAQAAQVDAMPEIRAWLADYADELDEQGFTDVAATIRTTAASIGASTAAEPAAQGEFDAEARSHARMIQDFPRLSAFFQKHALGSKLPVSCFACGHVGERAITHAELADVYVCTTCAERVATPPAQPAELPEFLKDPANVHVMMLRGAIAIPSIRSMVDLRGEVPNGEDAQLARIAELQEQVAALEAQPAERLPEVVGEVMAELGRAMAKFPTWPTDPLHAIGVVNEEVGELAKAVLQQVYEPHKNKPDDVRKEAVQAAAMAIRFLASMATYRFTPGEQHDQPALTAAQQADR